MQTKRYLLLWFALLWGPMACENDQAYVRLKVEATDSQGQIIPGAQIYINGAYIGETNGKGIFAGETELGQNARLELKVAKESSQFYFAPYYDTLMTNDEKIQVMARKAVLYSVPKPTLEEPEKVTTQDAEPKTDAVAITPKDAANPTVVAPDEQTQASATLRAEPTPEKAEKAAAIPTPQRADAMTQESSSSPSSLGQEPAHDSIIVLSHADEKPSDTVETTPPPTTKTALAYNVHVFADKQPLAGVRISYGTAEQGQLKPGCETSAQGRCLISFSTMPRTPVTFVVKHPGYLTKSHTVTVRPNGNLKFKLIKGETVDVFALAKTFQYIRGIAGAKVTIQGKAAGVTDQFGHLAYTYAGQKSDLIEVSIEAKEHLPANFTTDFVVAGPMSLIKYFAPPEAPRAKIAIAKARPAGDTADLKQLALFDKMDRELGQALHQALTQAPALTIVPITRVADMAQQNTTSVSAFVQNGWQQSDLKAEVDAIIQPTLVMSETPALEISAVNNSGQVIAAASRQTAANADAETLKKLARELTQSLLQAFPFEAAVTKIENQRVTINIGKESGRGLKAGDIIDVYGTQADKYGSVQSQERIAKVKIDRLAATAASGTIIHSSPRSLIEKGDIVLLRDRSPGTTKIEAISLSVRDKDGAISQANLYLDGKWIGATDQEGLAYVDREFKGRKGRLSIIKHGYTETSKDVTLSDKGAMSFNIEKAAAFLRLESEPSGALVKVDGKPLGKTPITTPIAVPSGFVTLEVEGPDNFKKHKTVLELDNGTLDLTGQRAIVLERDLRREAKRWLDQNKVDEAIAQYTAIPPQHSDYLLAQHELGELYLSVRKDPEKAAMAFAQVTSQAEVRDFSDKRFIGSHINQGIALCQWALKMQDRDEKAAATHLAEAIAIFDKLGPYLRYIDPSQAAQAVHNAAYHKALATHTLWQLSGNRQYLDAAVKAWSDYVDDKARQYPLDKNGINYVESAETYMRQAKAVQMTAPRL